MLAEKYSHVEESDAKPITAALFCLICEWAIEESNPYLWVLGLFQWNLVARSINIDPLTFHNIEKGQSDSIEFLPDSTKLIKEESLVQWKKYMVTRRSLW